MVVRRGCVVVGQRFEFEEVGFELESCSEATEAAIGAYDSMTGYDYRKGVSSESVAYCATGFRFADFRGKKAVRARMAPRYVAAGGPYSPLKRSCRGEVERDVEERCRYSVEIGAEEL